MPASLVEPPTVDNRSLRSDPSHPGFRLSGCRGLGTARSVNRRHDVRKRGVKTPKESPRCPRTFANHNDVAQDAEPLWRAGSQCDRDENETKGDSDRGESAERAGSGEVLAILRG